MLIDLLAKLYKLNTAARCVGFISYESVVCISLEE